ncbi:MAG TPA: GNAT family N-acetyltransferase [Candidatus Udaeobacter sp.]|nr:GNAT family N-acetyltransferase [Candidatus Udaeobacter sp.]
MITLELLTPQNAIVFKDIRLRALLDTPSAFSSTYAKESQLTDTDWVKRASRWSGEGSTGHLAINAGIPCGIACGYLDDDESTRAHLVSMWVAPAHRRLGIGCMLVNAIVDWARARSARTLELIVTSNNDAAIKFYERLGFTLTGKADPYRNDPALNDLGMIRSIS